MLEPREFPETRPSLLAGMRDDISGSPWREFFERYAPPVYRVARLRGLGPHDADDLVQQVMLAVSKRIGGFNYDRDRGRFRQWVRTIAENKIRDLHRRQRLRARKPLHDGPAEQPAADEIWEREWRMQDVLHCLDQVGAHVSQRRMNAFRMYVLDGWSAAATAKQLGMTIGHVYAIRSHIISLIRKRMHQLDESDDTP